MGKIQKTYALSGEMGRRVLANSPIGSGLGFKIACNFNKI